MFPGDKFWLGSQKKAICCPNELLTAASDKKILEQQVLIQIFSLSFFVNKILE